jgi:hypothetical protein
MSTKSCNENGDGANLCEAPSGPFRQISPVPFFVAEHIQHDTIAACIANARRATNGSPDPLSFRSELPNISCAGINSTGESHDS